MFKYTHYFRVPALCCALIASAASIHAASIQIGGTLTSDGAAVGSGDAVITNPATIQTSDAFQFSLTYDPLIFTTSGNTITLGSASAVLQFSGYTFNYSTGAGNYLSLTTPGVFGSGTTSFQFCSSLAGCASDDFLNFYFLGTVADLASLAGQASSLTGHAAASPAQFEFLRNFSDGSQTDLQGVITSSVGSEVPEPSTPALFALALLAMAANRPVRHALASR